MPPTANRSGDAPPPAPAPRSELEASLALSTAAARFEHALTEALRGQSVTPTQYRTLRILREAGEAGLSRKELRERMVARVPDATRLLDRLEAAGMVARTRDAADRRVVTTRITAEGLERLAPADARVDALVRAFFDSLSGVELKILVQLLERLGGE